jgi:adenine deaminase
MYNGHLVAHDGEYIADLHSPQYPEYFFTTMNVGRVVQAEDFVVRAPEGKNEVKIRVIGIPYPITRTEHRQAVVKVNNGEIPVDLDQDLIKITVLDRHHASGTQLLGR